MTTGSRGHGGHATNKTQSANAISNWQLLITNAYAELHVHGCTHVCPDPYLFAAPVGSDCKGRANPPLFYLVETIYLSLYQDLEFTVLRSMAGRKADTR